jgi:hypothetical protein
MDVKKESIMNALYKAFEILAAISLLVSGCTAQPAQTGQEERLLPKTAVYQSILGKPLTDEAVAEFIAGNRCSRADQFLLCRAPGMALWTDSSRVVETVYLYLNNEDGFEPYEGELPFGLKFYDNLAAVEYKLNRQGLGNAGLPDTTAVPDHMYYRAIYHQAGITVIYNSPFPDEDASINAILVSRQNRRTRDQS